MKGFDHLVVYKKTHELVLCVYKATSKFPRDELFGLVSQMRRCAVSVVANIVEGYGRRTIKDKLQFFYIARGSFTELTYYIELSKDLKYLSLDDYNAIEKLRDECGRLLHGFITSFK